MIEREHKYLVNDTSYKEMATSVSEITQGYLCREPHNTVRVRIYGDKGFITIKGVTRGDSRQEFEYEIPLADARELMKMCRQGVLRKLRYIVPFDGHKWEVDEFLNTVSPLTIAEIELGENEREYNRPPFVGREVTGDPEYYNSNIQTREEL